MTSQGKTGIILDMEKTWNQDSCSGSACLKCLLDICRHVRQAGRNACVQFQGEDRAGDLDLAVTDIYMVFTSIIMKLPGTEKYMQGRGQGDITS